MTKACAQGNDKPAVAAAGINFEPEWGRKEK
jgi:hypothetical protein